MIVTLLRWTGLLLVFVSVASLVWLFGRRAHERRQLLNRLHLSRIRRQSRRKDGILHWLVPPAILERTKDSFRERCEAASLKISWQQYVGLSASLGLIGSLLGYLYLENLTAAVLFGLVGLLLPDQVLSAGAGAHRERTNEQLQLAIQVVAMEYEINRSVPRTFTAAVPRLPEPIRSHFREAARRLGQGDDHNRVLDELAAKLNSFYGRLFCNTCKRLYETQQAGSMFDALAKELVQWRIWQRQNRAITTGFRVMGIALNLAVIPAYWFVSQVQPMTKSFFTDSLWGRLAIVLIGVSALTTFALNNILARE